MRTTAFRISAVATFIAMTLAGCMSDEANEPLPRMSKEKAEEWTRNFTDSMARSAGVKISEKTVDSTFHDCVGEDDEVAEDGRFNLDYYARAPLKVADHSAAVGKIREDLKKNGYKIEKFQKIEGEKPSVILDASDPDEGFNLSVRGYHPDDELFFSVSTPCLLPPGATQQQL